MRDLDGLIEKIEAIEGPDQEIDYEIGRTIIPDDWRDAVDDSGRPIKLNRTFRTQQQIGDSRPTASLDAAIALVERAGFDTAHDLSMGRSERGRNEGFKFWQMRLSLDRAEDDPDETGPVALGEHDHAAIALCLALARALQSQEKQ